MVFPRFAVLKSKQSGKYLSYVRDDPKTPKFIQSSGDDVASALAKFELEPAKTENGDGSKNVHIKSCYNNKYLCSLSEHLLWVVAGSDKKVENKTKWSCTLFEPIIESNDIENTIRLRHVHLGSYLFLDAFDESHHSMLFAGSPNGDSSKMSEVFKIIDSEYLLPKHVAFKGDNGKYLGGCTYRSNLHFLEFSFTDKAHKSVGNVVSILDDGCIRIKSNHNGKYWMTQHDGYWVRAESDESVMDEDSSRNLFPPVKVGENTIAIRNVSTDLFCKRLTDYWEDSLCANAPTITNEAKLVVEELVVSREISSIEYHISDAMIYSDSHDDIIWLSTLSVTNPSDQTDSIPLNFEYTDTNSSTWTSHYSLTFGVNVEFEASIPIIGKSKIEISASVSGGHQWGKTYQTTKKQNTGYTATVPPKSIVSVNLKATRASCRIPFSYTQRDIFMDGKEVISYKDDGIYTGSSYFKFDFQKETKPI